MIVTTPRPPQQVTLGEASCFNVRNNQLKNQLTASRRPTDLFRMILAN
jgi:hypothetical protein